MYLSFHAREEKTCACEQEAGFSASSSVDSPRWKPRASASFNILRDNLTSSQQISHNNKGTAQNTEEPRE